MEEALGGVRRGLRSGNGGGGNDFPCSGCSFFVPIEKLRSDSGVAGGEGGRLGARTWSSIQVLPCELGWNDCNCPWS